MIPGKLFQGELPQGSRGAGQMHRFYEPAGTKIKKNGTPRCCFLYPCSLTEQLLCFLS